MDFKKAGRYYWGIYLITPPHNVMAFADEVKVTNNGDLLLIGDNGAPVLIYAAGTWGHVWASSLLREGAPMAIEHSISREEES
jgi:hypothetical protein